MATRGRKPKPVELHVVGGTLNATRHAAALAAPDAGGSPVRPAKLKKREAELWDQYIETAFWLSSHDSAKAHQWCVLFAQWEKKPSEMTAAYFGQLRYLGSELGLDPASRARLGGNGKKEKPKKASYFT